MATRSDISVLWNLSPRLIIVDSPSTEITIQDLHDTLKDLEDEPGVLQYPSLIATAGKEDLGGGVSVGLTATLQNAQIMFERRTIILRQGTITTASIPGTLISVIDSTADFVADGVKLGDFVINTDDQGVGEIIEIVGPTELLILSPSGGAEDDFDVGEAYNVYYVAECSISGGNLVAIDDDGNNIAAVFPSFGTFVIRTSSSSATLQEQATDVVLDQQSVRDALLLDPSPTIAPEAESIDAKLDDIAQSQVDIDQQSVRDAMALPLSPTTSPGETSVDARLITIEENTNNLDFTQVNEHTTEEINRVIGALNEQTATLIEEIQQSGLSDESKQELVDAVCRCVESIEIVAVRERIVVGPCDQTENTDAQQESIPKPEKQTPQVIPPVIKQVPKPIPRKPRL